MKRRSIKMLSAVVLWASFGAMLACPAVLYAQNATSEVEAFNSFGSAFGNNGAPGSGPGGGPPPGSGTPPNPSPTPETIEARFTVAAQGKQIKLDCASCHWMEVHVDNRKLNFEETITLKKGKAYEVTVKDNPQTSGTPPQGATPPEHDTQTYSVWPIPAGNQTITPIPSENSADPPKAFLVQKDQILQYLIDNSEGLLAENKPWPQNPADEPMNKKARLLPVEVEVIHTEKMRDDNGVELSTTVSPGKDTLLRDEIADLRIKIPPLGTADWDLKIDLEPTDMKTQTLGSRGSVQMYDFGKIENGNVTPLTTEANGSTKAGPYDIKLLASKGGEETFRIAVNKEGKLKIRVKTADNKIDVTSQEFTVTKRIRKYGKDTATATYDFNKHDKHFENAATSWGAFYQHPVDDVERLKAIGMTESELGRNPQNSSSRPNDIMTIGHPDDHVLDTLRFVAGHREKEVDPQNNAVRDMNYPQAAESPAGTAIHWGTCWVYHKAQTIANNPQPPPSFIPGPWCSWDDATTRYNGGGVNNYLERVTRAFREGRHPTDQNTLWPVLTNGRARK